MIFVSPVVVKELRTMMRGRKAFWLLFLLLLAAGGVFGVAWLGMTEGGAPLSRRSMMARGLFATLSLVQLFAFSLISPMMTATVVTTERENKTLDLLFCTGLTRLHLVFGKWFSAIFYQLVLFICLLPIAALVFQLGGVGLDEYLFAGLTILMAIATYGMVGLACSTVYRRTTAAMTATLLLILFFNVFLQLGILMGAGVFDWWDEDAIFGGAPGAPGTSPFLSWLFWSPGPVTIWVIKSVYLFEPSAGSSFSLATIFADPLFRGHMLFQGVVFAIAAAIAWTRLAEIRAPRVKAAASTRRPRRIRRSRSPAEFPDGYNPVYIKERQTGGRRRLHWLILAGYLFLLGCLAYADSGGRSFSDAVAISGFSVSYILFFVPVLTATALSIEREERTLDLLTVTLLSPRRIVLGKFVNSMRLMAVMAAGVLLLPVLHPIVRTIFGESVRGGYSIDYLLKIVVFLLGYSALFTSMGLLCSSYCRRNGAAIVTCFMAGLFMLLAPFVGLLLADLVDNTIGPRTGSRPAWMIVAAPLHFSLKLLAPLMSPFYYLSGLNQSQHGEFHNLFTNNSWKSWTVILLHAASVGALALAFLAAAARRLAREIR